MVRDGVNQQGRFQLVWYCQHTAWRRVSMFACTFRARRVAQVFPGSCAVAKHVRALRKKIRQIEVLTERADAGAAELTVEQKSKVGSLPQL